MIDKESMITFIRTYDTSFHQWRIYLDFSNICTTDPFVLVSLNNEGHKKKFTKNQVLKFIYLSIKHHCSLFCYEDYLFNISNIESVHIIDEIDIQISELKLPDDWLRRYTIYNSIHNKSLEELDFFLRTNL